MLGLIQSLCRHRMTSGHFRRPLAIGQEGLPFVCPVLSCPVLCLFLFSVCFFLCLFCPVLSNPNRCVWLFRIKRWYFWYISQPGGRPGGPWTHRLAACVHRPSRRGSARPADRVGRQVDAATRPPAFTGRAGAARRGRQTASAGRWTRPPGRPRSPAEPARLGAAGRPRRPAGGRGCPAARVHRVFMLHVFILRVVMLHVVNLLVSFYMFSCKCMKTC